MTSYTAETRGLPHVVIIGGGFGGLWAARALRGQPVRVTVIDRTNHHLFQPLLYQVALAGLAPSDIAIPIRWALRDDPHVTVVLDDMRSIDPAARRLALGSGKALAYDYLIVAAGSRHSYFNHVEWETVAPGLKTLDDAMEIRRRFLLAFERAEWEDDPAARAVATTIVIVGGGPTGVELAGMASELVHRALPADFRRVDTRTARVILLEGGPRLLPAFPERLGERARADLEALGVEVRTDALVGAVDADGVTVGGERIAARNVFWAAGNAASPLGAQLGAPVDRAGRVLVNQDLSVPGHPEVFVVGDLAALKRADGSWHPGVAQVAMQGGECAARNVARLVLHGSTQPFRYKNLGDMATIGRNRAVGDLPWASVTGRFAWWMWLGIHIVQLIGFRNRASVLIQWAYAYFTFDRGVRLITARDRRG